ncbi:hypothetical protein M9Y10_004122 [Tritrichomonas musculus]|uniref:Calcineurin-like phosphoesterase domain-containing protein n=1 Tax=Tritrichomonas musculus TaxID=1915356 RepID=A0ABR2JRI2_9EUKA
MSDQKRWVAYHVEDPSKPQPDGAIRIMCMSDTHSKHKCIPQEYIYPADIAVHAGDFTRVFDFEVKECALGDPYLAYKIQQCKTPLHIFGHTHCCNGFYRHGPTLYVNCAVVDLYNKYNCPPIYIDMIKSDQKFEVPDHYFSQQELIEMSFYKNEAFN